LWRYAGGGAEWEAGMGGLAWSEWTGRAGQMAGGDAGKGGLGWVGMGWEGEGGGRRILTDSAVWPVSTRVRCWEAVLLGESSPSVRQPIH
jgi:hypothetical protein